MRKYKLGITFNLEAEVKDIWSNGVNQNVIHLYTLFKSSDLVEDIYLVSWGLENTTTPPSGFMLDGMDLKFAYVNDVIDDLDVLIEGSITIEPSQVRRMHSHGGKVVSYKMGNSYIMDVEYFLFDRRAGRLFNGAKFDAIWMLPHHDKMCRSYLSIMQHCESYIVPYIWSPIFCDKVIKNLDDKYQLKFGYKPDLSQKSKRLACFEPNSNVVKTCFTPILICEQAYRTAPEKIKHFYACNTYNKKDNPTFFNFIGRTELVRDDIMTVERRYQLPDYLTRYVDIVVSHQWENGLNNAYNDILYGGYPLIHNSPFLPKGVGYYYPEFDAFEGAKVLLDVIENHDKQHEAYVKRANEYLESLLPTNPVNVYLYEKELKRLFEE
ncbi:hypothetical protein A4G20_06885 [Pasteurellaceae bacterium RH1A]|nr:hypothetical protein A4G20_06885 [Pasteurellaceae bacterium RH1A]